jgi:outer membrane protein assembly factor BamB
MRLLPPLAALAVLVGQAIPPASVGAELAAVQLADGQAKPPAPPKQIPTAIAFAEDWPQWRGPSMNGISRERNLPVRWSPTEHIAWKLALPDKSGSTPVIWGNAVFLNVAEGDTVSLWRVDKASGAVAWKRPITGGNYKINKQNMSTPSPVTDGAAVYVMTGVGVMKSFDFDGKEKWARDIQKDYGRFGLNWGYASSPLLYENGLFVEVLHGMKTKDPSYLLRIDKKTGATVWRVERPTDAIGESPDSYTTPQLLLRGSQAEIVVSGAGYVTSHDPATGKELWRAGGLNPEKKSDFRTIASALVFDDIVYVPTRVRPLIAFRAGGRGDVTASHRLWSFNNGPDVPTPVTDGKYFYVVNDRGLVWCLDAKTGQEIWGSQRLKPAVYSSSPVLADGKLYFGNENGLITVVKAGPQFEILAENDMADYMLASPAISSGRIFIRTTQYLWAVE